VNENNSELFSQVEDALWHELEELDQLLNDLTGPYFDYAAGVETYGDAIAAMPEELRAEVEWIPAEIDRLEAEIRSCDSGVQW
jgi:hypothetical protein